MSAPSLSPPGRILPVIVFSQFAATSLWFAGNAILPQIENQWALPDGALATLTSMVQGGFILGTLAFAFFSIPDRFSPRAVFLVCACLGSLANAGVLFAGQNYHALLLFRGIAGFFLAGLYPVGMRIAAGWYQGGLGRALGFLVGALVLGTAFPHLLQGMSIALSWQWVTLLVSVLALTGGVALFLLVPDGPHIKSGTSFDHRALVRVFSSAEFRGSAFGYFGHMWELYAFWAFVPVFLAAHLTLAASLSFDISIWSFLIVAVGFLGCAAGGVIALRVGSAPVAFYQLLTSALCCLLSPLAFSLPTPWFLMFMLIWGDHSCRRLTSVLRVERENRATIAGRHRADYCELHRFRGNDHQYIPRWYGREVVGTIADVPGSAAGAAIRIVVNAKTAENHMNWGRPALCSLLKSYEVRIPVDRTHQTTTF